MVPVSSQSGTHTHTHTRTGYTGMELKYILLPTETMQSILNNPLKVINY